MNVPASQYWQHASELARSLLEAHGGNLTVAMPLGLGKANHIINALYEQVRENSHYSLKIFTALTLQTPQPAADLEKAFFEPIKARLYDGYSELLYARDLIANRLPNNVQVSEFFLQAGAYLNNPHTQAHYISANYSHASSYLLNQQIDVVLQLVAHNHAMQGRGADLSLSCNPDITLELLAARAAGKTHFLLVGELNNALPFMTNDAQIPASEFAHVLEGESAGASLFNIPKPAVHFAEYAAGFHASSLIKDGGTLQIGIGSVGDAVAYALILRQQNNAAYRQIITALNGDSDVSHLHLEPFSIGLNAVSEMLVDVFLDLLQAGVIKRRVEGILLTGGFFLGPNSLYQRLRDMPPEQRDSINMTRIGFINSAHEGFAQKQQNRQHARFINNAMKVTLLGAVVSDGLESGQVVSGVGGQYDFVRQAFDLEGARSIIMLKAQRTSNGKPSSNVVWSYGHTTIPRHLRDIFVTEYGIADVRGADDQTVIARLLAITDSQFQYNLLREAQANHKIDPNFKLYPTWEHNTQRDVQQRLQPFKQAGLLPDYPFGTDFTELEQSLIPALQALKQASKSPLALARLAAKGFFGASANQHELSLGRLGLNQPHTIRDKFTRLLMLGALQSK